MNELASVIAEEMRVERKVKNLDARHEVQVAFSDHSRCERAFQINQEKVSLKAGIARMATWVREHGARKSSNFTKIEIVKNMPKSWTEGSKEK